MRKFFVYHIATSEIMTMTLLGLLSLATWLMSWDWLVPLIASIVFREPDSSYLSTKAQPEDEVRIRSQNEKLILFSIVVNFYRHKISFAFLAFHNSCSLRCWPETQPASIELATSNSCKIVLRDFWKANRNIITILSKECSLIKT